MESCPDGYDHLYSNPEGGSKICGFFRPDASGYCWLCSMDNGVYSFVTDECQAEGICFLL